MKKHFGHRLIKKRRSRYHTSLLRAGKGDCVSGARVLSYAEQMRLSFPVLPTVFHAIFTLSAPAWHLPLEGKAAIRKIPSSKQAAHHPCEPIRSPSTVIPSAAEVSLLHCRHMHTCALTQTTPWCFLFRLSLTHGLPVCKKDPSTSVGMTGGRRIASHSLSHRFVDPSCAFGAALLQGPTRIVVMTGNP